MPNQMTPAETIAVLQEVRDWHRDPTSREYNQCESPGEECLWCENAARAIEFLRVAFAELEALKATLHDEIAANLAFREVGGALPDEDMPTFCARLARDSKRYKWLANDVLACDYGDNESEPPEIGWNIRGDRKHGPIMYGPSIDAAIDAKLPTPPPEPDHG